MTDLQHSLAGAGFVQLKLLAEKWGLPFQSRDAREGLAELLEGLLKAGLLAGAAEDLSPEEREALLWLEAREGREPWDHFSRQFGEIREMGAARLERERPDLDPISPAESLWYRALIARGFFQIPEGSREFVYIPDEVRQLLIPFLTPEIGPLRADGFSCRKAAPRERTNTYPASGIILDHLCTLLAGWRMGIDPGIHLPGVAEPQQDFYRQLARDLDLLEEQGSPYPEKVRDFFELSREQCLLKLWETWRHSEANSDLRSVRTIQLEGNPEMDPRRVREAVIAYLSALDKKEWWSLESFISRVKELDPDLMRRGGDYDSWFVKEASSGEFLQGFQHWDRVEGALLRYLLTGPLHWLGLLDLGLPEENEPPLSFRVSASTSSLLQGLEPSLTPRNADEVQIRSKGEIRITANVPAKTRYQIARFCDWTAIKAEAYMYALTPGSLRRAESQGLRVAHLTSLLEKHTGQIPPNILAALERWEKAGGQASISRKTVLRLGSPAILKALKKSPAARYILEQLGPTTVVVSDGSSEKIREALVELGFFLESVDQDGSQT
jgi:hypothetical protein